MNIAIVSRRWPPYAGGAEQQLCRVADALMKQGHHIRVFTGANAAASSLRGLDTEVVRLWDPEVRWLGTAVFLLQLFAYLLFYSRWCTVMLLSMINETTAISALTCRITGTPMAIRLSAAGNVGNFAWTRQRRIGSIYRCAARMAARVICQTSASVEEAVAYGVPASKIRVMRNCAPSSQSACNEERKFNGSRANILWCGRLSPEKNPDMALDVMEVLLNDNIQASLTMVGQGELQAAIESRLAENEVLSRGLRVVGFLEDTTACYQDADILMLTSNEDAQPNVILEAMASGVPVLATAVGGVPEMVRDGQTGILVPPGDIDAMVAAVKELVEDPEKRKRLSAAGHRYVAEHHAPGKIAAQYEELFTGLVTENSIGKEGQVD